MLKCEQIPFLRWRHITAFAKFSVLPKSYFKSVQQLLSQFSSRSEQCGGNGAQRPHLSPTGTSHLTTGRSGSRHNSRNQRHTKEELRTRRQHGDREFGRSGRDDSRHTESTDRLTGSIIGALLALLSPQTTRLRVHLP